MSLFDLVKNFIGPFNTTRAIRTPDSPQRAAQIVKNIKLEDCFVTMGPPPLVHVVAKGVGHWEANGPGMWVTVKVTVESDGGGGSIVTEHTTSKSIMPGGGIWADTVHAFATSLEKGYTKARQRS